MIATVPDFVPGAIGEALAASKHTFHPCGSRFVGFAREDSDYDLLVQDSDEADQELRQLGFIVRMSDEYKYKDSHTARVLQHVDAVTGVVVQVQLCRELWSKLAVTRMLKESETFREMHKQVWGAERSDIWESAGWWFRHVDAPEDI